MRRTSVLLLAAGLLLAACGGGEATSSSASSSSATASSIDDGLVDIGAGLHGVTGLRAAIYATGLAHASAFALDDAGRLWVATADYSDQGQDGIYVVTAAGATPTKVINGLRTPLGMLWHSGSLYVAATGSITAYSGFDRTAFATSTTIVTLPDGVGETNGITLAPDGRMQVGISAPCDHCTPTLPMSAAIISFLPDGSDVKVDATGIRAPIALAYLPGTSDLFVTMNQRDDLGDSTPGDWLSLVQDGQDWGFPDCYGQGGTSCDNQPQPVAVLDKHAAVSGLALVQEQLGASGAAAIVAEWADAKLLQVQLTKVGATYSSSVRPFIEGLQNPVPLLLDSNGTLFVGDWGSGTVYAITSG